MARLISRGLFATLAIASLLTGCDPDPYDPIIGPRNPVPGAKRHLASRTDSPSEIQALLNYRPCSPELLDNLSREASREVRSLVAANPSITPEIIGRLITDPEPGVRAYLGLNPVTPRWALLQLRNDPNPNVTWGLARNPNWLPEDLRKMFMEKSVAPVLIAGNPSTPPDILEQLSHSKDRAVQTALANNPKISLSTIRWLVREGNSATKKMLVDNPATPREIVEQLAKDDEPEVGRFAKEYLKGLAP